MTIIHCTIGGVEPRLKHASDILNDVCQNGVNVMRCHGHVRVRVVVLFRVGAWRLQVLEKCVDQAVRGGMGMRDVVLMQQVVKST